LRATIYVILFFLVLLTPFVLRDLTGAAVSADLSTTGESLVIITPHDSLLRREFAQAFSQWHRDHYGSPVSLDFRSVSGTQNIKRQLQTTYDSLRDSQGRLPPEETIADKLNLQIAWGGGNTFFDSELKPLGILSPLHLSPQQIHEIFPQTSLAGVDLLDPSKDGGPRWVGYCLSGFGIMYNPDLYASLDLPPPKTWSDLTNPKLFDMVSLADPTHSASVGVCYIMVIQRAMADAEAAFLKTLPTGSVLIGANSPNTQSPAYHAALAAGFKTGLKTLIRIAANSRSNADSATVPPMEVADGQAAAALAIDFYAHTFMELIGDSRGRFVVPENATAITPDPVAILYGTVGRKRELADHFVEFLLSRPGQLLWILKAGVPGGPHQRALRRVPIRRDVYSEDRSNWADPTANPFTDAGSFNMRGQWMSFFGDIRPIWAAAWIDDRDDLIDAYSKILEISDPARQAELLDELSDIPATYDDILSDGVTRKQHEAMGDADQWKAQSRIDWAKKFRDHYRAIAAKAEAPQTNATIIPRPLPNPNPNLNPLLNLNLALTPNLLTSTHS